MRPQDHAYEFVLRSAIPLVLAPVGASPATRRLRGVVRVDTGHARVAFTDDPATSHGVAFHITLPDTHQPDYAHTTLARLRILATEHWTSDTHDSHHNLIVDAAPAGDRPGDFADQNLYNLFSTLLGASGVPWYTDTFTIAGFMLIPADHIRLYTHDERSGLTYGAQFPVHGGYSNLAQELMPLIREGHLQQLPRIDDADDYCAAVYDISTFTGPR
jgi:hypothetical protein